MWLGKHVTTLAVFLLICSLPADAQSVEEELEIGTPLECAGSQQRISDSQGTLIFPPAGTITYADSCSWTLTIDAGNDNDILILKFDSFSLGSGDVVTIADTQFGGNYDVDFDLDNRPTGDPISAFGDIVLVRFSSDDDGIVGTGFKISWYLDLSGATTPSGLPRGTVFKTVLQNVEYSISSPNYPGDYPLNKELYWVLTAAEVTDRIQLSFKEFELSLDDYLTIYEGIDPSNEFELVRYSGSKTSLPRSVISQTNQVLVVFFSSRHVAAKGFSIRYYVYFPRVQTTEAPEGPGGIRPLTVQERAAIIVVSCLILIVIGILCVYIFYWRPKQKAEEQQIARELYDNNADPSIAVDHIPRRPTTAAAIARLRAESHMNTEYGLSDNGMFVRNNAYEANSERIPDQQYLRTAGQPPRIIDQHPGVTGQRPGTAGQRPGTAGQRPGTAGQRPGTAGQRPDTAGQRPGTAGQRPSSGLNPSLQNEDEDPDAIVHVETSWSRKLDDHRFEPLVGPSQPLQTSEQHPPSYNSLGENGRGSFRRESLPPLDLSTTQPVKIKKKKKRNKQKFDPEDTTDTIITTSRLTSARPNSGLRSSSTAPELTELGVTSSKLPGYVLRSHEGEDDW